MKCLYDFHIHTCLSPCASDELTPNNVVNFAKMQGYDAIAICDHNSGKNVASCQEIAREVGIVVVPGMEVTTAEDVHIVCLFETVEKLELLEEFVDSRREKIPNDEKIFGNQIIMDKNDEEVGRHQNLLLYGIAIDIYELVEKVEEIGGVCFPAHVFREGSGIVPNIGGVDEALNFFMIELGDNATKEQLEKFKLEGYFQLHNSDTHYLENLEEAQNYIPCEKSVEGIFEFFKQQKEKGKNSK